MSRGCSILYAARVATPDRCPGRSRRPTRPTRS